MAHKAELLIIATIVHLEKTFIFYKNKEVENNPSRLLNNPRLTRKIYLGVFDSFFTQIKKLHHYPVKAGLIRSMAMRDRPYFFASTGQFSATMLLVLAMMFLASACLT